MCLVEHHMLYWEKAQSRQVKKREREAIINSQSGCTGISRFLKNSQSSGTGNRNAFSFLLLLLSWTHLAQGPQRAILIPEVTWPFWLHLYHQLFLSSSVSVQTTERELGPALRFNLGYTLHMPEPQWPVVTEDGLCCPFNSNSKCGRHIDLPRQKSCFNDSELEQKWTFLVYNFTFWSWCQLQHPQATLQSYHEWWKCEKTMGLA